MKQSTQRKYQVNYIYTEESGLYTGQTFGGVKIGS